MEKRKYDSSIARMAGNIAAGLVKGQDMDLIDERRKIRCIEIADFALDLAYTIVETIENIEREQQS